MAEWSKKREVMQHYDNVATVYDARYSEEQNAKIKALLDETNIQPNNIILDMGCGTGLLFKHIKNSAKLLVGLDTSLSLLRIAKTRAKRFHNTAVVRAEADHTPFKAGTFHAIFTITLLQNMPDPSVTLREIGRIGKDNATVAITALKVKFTGKAFARLLKNAGLTPTTQKANSELKDYAAICKYNAEAKERGD